MATGCTRSHPHELMDKTCEEMTVLARHRNEKAQQDQPLSIASLKANLYYYELLKLKAFEEHKAAIIKAHEASTALNNALLRVR